MTLNEYIEHLVNLRKQHGGDIKCFTNGEHGVDNIIPLSNTEIEIGKADLVFDGETFNEMSKYHGVENESEIVLHVGGW